MVLVLVTVAAVFGVRTTGAQAAASSTFFEDLPVPQQQAIADWLTRAIGPVMGEGGYVQLPYMDSYPVNASAAIQSAFDNLASTTADPAGLALGEIKLLENAGLSTLADGTSMDLLPMAIDIPGGVAVALAVQVTPMLYMLVSGGSDLQPLPGAAPSVTSAHLCLNFAYGQSGSLWCPPGSGPHITSETYPWYDAAALTGAIGAGYIGATEQNTFTWAQTADCAQFGTPDAAGNSGGCAGLLDPSGAPSPVYLVLGDTNTDSYPAQFESSLCPGSGEFGALFPNGYPPGATFQLAGMPTADCVVQDQSTGQDTVYPGAGVLAYMPGNNTEQIASGLTSRPGDIGGNATSPDQTPSAVMTNCCSPDGSTVEAGAKAGLDNTGDTLHNAPDLQELQNTLQTVFTSNPVYVPPVEVAIPAPLPSEVVTHYETRLNQLGFTNIVVTRLDPTTYDPFLPPDAVVTVTPQPGTKLNPASDPVVTVSANPATNPASSPTSTPTGTPTTTPPTYNGTNVPPIVWPNVATPCDVFPFGVPCWLVAQLNQFVATPVAPSFSFAMPYGQSLTIDLGNVGGYDLSQVMVWVRPLMVFGAAIGYLLWLAGRPPAGFRASEGSDGSQGVLDTGGA